MAAWWPYLSFRYLDSVGGMASRASLEFAQEFQFLISNACCLFHMHAVCNHGPKPIHFQICHFQNGRLAAILGFSFFLTLTSVWLWISSSNSVVHHLCIWISLLMSLSKWPPGGHITFFGFRTLNFSLAFDIKSILQYQIICAYRKNPIDSQQCHFQNGGPHWVFHFPDSLLKFGFEHQIQTSVAHHLWA